MRAKAAIRLSFFCFLHLCADEALAEAQAESGGGRHTHFYSHTRSKKEIFRNRQHCSHFFFVLHSFSEGGSLSSARVWPKAIEEAQALLNHRNFSEGESGRGLHTHSHIHTHSKKDFLESVYIAPVLRSSTLFHNHNFLYD